MSFSDAIQTDTTAPKRTPTPEQQAIIDAALSSTDSILINALAGAAKTTTLEMICQRMPVMPILSLAFNKRIAEEMTRRLPGNVQCRTLNSLGHRVWMKAATGKILLNTRKSYEILKDKVESLPRKDKTEAYEVFADTLKAVGKAKVAGYIPDGKYPQAYRLTASDDFWADFDEEEVDRVLVDETLTESIRQAYLGHIDFDDQIYMPTLFGGSFPKFPLVMCDEVQDLSEINHAMLEKLVTQRLIAVGDPYQSIYRFRGAKSSGMASLREKFNMKEMGLSVSFRCPISVVENAQRIRTPHMKYPTWAKQGRVNRLESWDADSIEDGAVIICRNNAPLFSLAFKLLALGRGVKIIGMDIGPNLIRTLKKLGDLSMTQAQVLAAIDRWEAEKLLKDKQKGATKDKAECLRVFAGFGKTLNEAIAYTEDLFKSSGPIQMLSGHKSKGLEWDIVYHLDPWRIPSQYALTEEEEEQEHNVRYVIETRAKECLYLVDTKDFRDGSQ